MCLFLDEGSGREAGKGEGFNALLLKGDFRTLPHQDTGVFDSDLAEEYYPKLKKRMTYVDVLNHVERTVM